MTTVFFYGLFMDPDLLKGKGLNPQNVKPAYLEGYQLQIGERATLSPREGACSYGMVMDLAGVELEKLYGADGLEDYVPRKVQVTIRDGDLLPVLSYLLPMEKITGSNRGYAARLAQVAEKIGLPQDYISEIRSWI